MFGFMMFCMEAEDELFFILPILWPICLPTFLILSVYCYVLEIKRLIANFLLSLKTRN